MVRFFLFLFCLFSVTLRADVDLGIDVFFAEGHHKPLRGKRIGLVTNHTGVNRDLVPTAKLLKDHLQLVALFSPEHGLKGNGYAFEKVADDNTLDQIPIYSLHGSTRRPTNEMLKKIDVLIYDIQDIGVRSYTYATTLFYVMEEAAKRKIPVIVLDRPNPINGMIVDGTMLDQKWRSYIGYINVPYCHGMTIGELALFFNGEYKIGCQLKVVPMRGWKRRMSFKDTGLEWIPTSPHIPEADTPLFYASTGILGELDIVNHGVGYTLPFKVVGAPWLDAEEFATKLNQQRLPGVKFLPFHYRPFYGSLKGQECHGVLIRVTDKLRYRPLSVQYLLLGMLKSLYPDRVKASIGGINQTKRDLFCKANGNSEVLRIMNEEQYAAWKMISYEKQERGDFEKLRAKYLISEY